MYSNWVFLRHLLLSLIFQADLVVAGCEAELARRIGLRIDAIISKVRR